jgi:alkylation response protein AidB-like acyl-CoA dehydrogenase
MEGPAAVSPATDAAVAGQASAAPPTAATGLPDLLYSDTETELRAAVRALLQDRCGWREVLARTETAQTYDTGLWRVLAADLGCAGLLIPESSGGTGASYREAAVVAEETGRAVAPVPFLGSAVAATTALLARVTTSCCPAWPRARPRWHSASRSRPLRDPGPSPRSG